MTLSTAPGIRVETWSVSSQPCPSPVVNDNTVQDFFLNAMSHELRTPLATAVNNAELVLVREPDTIHKDVLEEIHREIDLMSSLSHANIV